MDPGVRGELSATLRQLAERLQPVVDDICKAQELCAAAEVSL